MILSRVIVTLIYFVPIICSNATGKRSCVKFAKIILKIHTRYQLFHRQKVKYPFQISKSHFIILYKPIVLGGCFPTMAFLWPDNTFKCSDIKENIVTRIYITLIEMVDVSTKLNGWDKSFTFNDIMAETSIKIWYR